jgi:chromosome partitioning protein
MTKRISIINFKGGVGKTALAFHLATGLERYHKERVLLVDVDHQSSLSLTILKPKEWEKAVEEGRTLNSIFEHFTIPGTKLPGKEIIYKKPYPYDYPKLDLLPATLKLDETEIELTSTAIGDPMVSEWNKRTLICKWIEENRVAEDYSYIIFDCPPATKLVTQNAIATSHAYVIPVIPDAVSTRGIPHLIGRMFVKIDEKLADLADILKRRKKKLFSTYVPKTRLAAIVIFKIKTSGMSYSGYTLDHTRHLNSINRDYSKYIIEPYIVDGVGVPECMARGLPVYDFPNTQNVRTRGFVDRFKKITKQIKQRVDEL